MPNPIKSTYFKRIISILMIGLFFITSLNLPLAQAQELRLPAPGVMVHLSPPLDPPILKGIKVHTDNPFRFDFILNKGDSQLGKAQLKEESSRLIKYFLASLTIPEKDLWVNLSPYEKDRIIPNGFGLTEMGRDLLAEDYMLKQVTASLIYPEDGVGRKFWKRIYEEAAKKYGTTNIPVNTFNKVWIVPEKAVVYENAKAGTSYVVESRLKVMLEQDYLSLQKHEGIKSESQDQEKQTNQLGSQIVREVVIPELTKEVNENKNFVKLRQVYNSLILATWYKKKIKDSILAQVYADKNKVAGVTIDDPQEEGRIYQQYLRAFKKGVYNYIKEEIDPLTQENIPRKYFSGGVDLAALSGNTKTKLASTAILKITNQTDFAMYVKDNDDLIVQAQLNESSPNVTGTTTISTIKFGNMNIEVRCPAFYQSEGLSRVLNFSLIKTAVGTAIGELQKERSDFNINKIKRIEIINDVDHPAENRTGTIYIPLQILVSNLIGVGILDVDAFRDEWIKYLIYHEEGEFEGGTVAQLDRRDLEYLADQEPQSPIPVYLNAPAVNYRIIVPIFDEGSQLEEILTKIKSLGYLSRITFVNDASTDNSRAILEKWERTDGIEVVHLNENRKKEGAIRAVMEKLKNSNRLPEKTILLDADSFIPVRAGESLDQMIAEASAQMDKEDITGMAFRYDIHLPPNPSLLQRALYADFAGFRFINKVAKKQHQLWVINGRGGIFRSDVLLETLQDMVPDFETGDLLITVKMMKGGHKVAYYDKIRVETKDVDTIGDYFKQRRRWERGTAKVFFNEKEFYGREIMKFSKIGVLSLFNIAIRVGIPIGLSRLFLTGEDLKTFAIKLLIGMVIWMAIGASAAIFDKGIRKEGFSWKIVKWSILNAFLYMGVTIPARAMGLYDAVNYSYKKRINDAGKLVGPQLKENPGGIDLTSDKALVIQNNGLGIKFHLDPAMLQQLQNAPGFVPVIINIQPMTSLRRFLELNVQESAPAVS